MLLIRRRRAWAKGGHPEMTSTEVLTPHWIISMKFTGSHKTLVNRFWGNTAKYIVCPKEITTAKQHSSILMRSALLTKPCKVSCADLFFHMYIYIYIYCKMRRQGVEVQSLGHTNLFTKVLCIPVCHLHNLLFLVICVEVIC